MGIIIIKRICNGLDFKYNNVLQFTNMDSVKSRATWTNIILIYK